MKSYLEFNWFNALITALQNKEAKLANLIVEGESNWRFHLSGKYLPPFSPHFYYSKSSPSSFEAFVSLEKPECLFHFCSTELEKEIGSLSGNQLEGSSSPGGENPQGPSWLLFTFHVYTKECHVTPKREREPTGLPLWLLEKWSVPEKWRFRIKCAGERNTFCPLRRYSMDYESLLYSVEKRRILKYFFLASRSLDFHLRLPGRLKLTVSLWAQKEWEWKAK